MPAKFASQYHELAYQIRASISTTHSDAITVGSGHAVMTGQVVPAGDYVVW